MKTSIIFFLVVIFLEFSNQSAFAQSEAIKSFASGLQNGNTKEIVNSFNENIELNIEGNKQSVNKSQSESMLKAFMDKHPLSKFEYTHKGASGNSSFAIGKYVSNQSTYRVVVKVNGDMIEKVDFTKE